jgi:hypothetical protein
MGVGIWSMHFVGMLAFHLPVPVGYDGVLVLLSVFVAVAASALALFVASRPSLPLPVLAVRLPHQAHETAVAREPQSVPLVADGREP